MNREIDILVKLGIDPALAALGIQRIKQMREETANFITTMRQVSSEGRKLRTVGAVVAATGAGILAPFILEANEYVKRYKGLEQTANDFTAAQQRQANAAASFGRVAASALVPVMNEVADLQERISAFANAHPELVKAAIGGGALLVAGGGALVAAGTAVTTIARAAELLKVALGSNSGLEGLAGVALKSAAALGALAVGAEIGEKLVNKLGEAYNIQYLKTFKLSDALDTFGKIVGVVIGSVPASITLLLAQLSNLASGLDSVVSYFKKIPLGIDSMLDQIATAARNFVNSLPGQNNPQAEQTSVIAALDKIGEKLGDTGQDLEKLLDGNVSQATLDYVNREIDRRTAATEIDQSTTPFQSLVNPFVTGLQSWVNGTLKPLLGNFVGGLFGGSGLSQNIGNFLGGSGKVSASAPTMGFPPEAVNAYIELRKAQANSDRQYAEDSKRIDTEYQNSELKAKTDHASKLLQITEEQAQAEAELTARFTGDSLKAKAEFESNETNIQKQAQFQRKQNDEKYYASLNKFAADRDVAGFIEAELSHNLESKQSDEQATFDAQQRKEQFDKEQSDRQQQYQTELASLKQQGEKKVREENAQYQREEEDRKQAYNDQLAALKTKHDDEYRVLQQHYAETLAGLQDNVAGLKDIHDRFYADMTAAAQDYVTKNRAILQQLYGQSLGVPTSAQSGGSTGSMLAGMPSSSAAPTYGDYYTQYQQQRQPVTVHIANLNMGAVATPQDVQTATDNIMTAVIQGQRAGGGYNKVM